ncbi:MAG: DUF4446 family protein [Lachnospiraceae bacterium]|nr:DUF4446 family protein [Lachnospiraceae bacterium]
MLDLNTVNYGVIITGVVAGMAVLLIVVIVLLFITMSKLKKLSRSYKNFMRGKDTESLEDVIIAKFQEIEQLKRIEKENKRQMEELAQSFILAYQKIGIIKYDAFQEMGGKLSFALALLNKSNNGFVLNSMHSREGCYTYIKEIIDGKSYIKLSEEEKKAVDTAVNFNGLE